MKKFCSHCGNPFESLRSSRLYCSDNCKQLAYYKRNGLILSGNKTVANAVAGIATVKGVIDLKDVKYAGSMADSFTTCLLALIEEEVARRTAKKIDYPKNATVKDPVTVKQYFTVNDNVDPIFNLGEESINAIDSGITTEQNINGDDVKDVSIESEEYQNKIQIEPLLEDEDELISNDGELEQEAEIISDELLSAAYETKNPSLPENNSLARSVIEEDVTLKKNGKLLSTEQFHWVYSSFTERINNHLTYSEEDISGYINRFGNKGVKVLEIFKCLLRHLMVLSNRNEIRQSSFISLSNVFYKLVNTREFQSLPKEFLYHSKIVALQKKIRSFAQSTYNEAFIRLYLSSEQRAAFFAILYEMGDKVKDVKFQEIGFRTK